MQASAFFNMPRAGNQVSEGTAQGKSGSQP